MSITDELRKYASDASTRKDYMAGLAFDLNRIADRIDAEHKRTMAAAAFIAGVPVTDENMAEHGWYKALDADKQPIKLGDEVYQVEGGLVYTVESITFYPDNTTVTFSCKHGFGCDNAHNVRHYHTPTVEDLLCELLDKVDDDRAGQAEIIAEYAAKLRLADDGKEQ